MSRENIELVRRATDAFNEGEPEGYLADMAPDFEYVSSGVIPGGTGVYRGPEEYRRFLDQLWDEFEGTHVEIREATDVGDKVVVCLTIDARGKRSGAETTWTFFQVWTVRDGKITRGQGFPGWKEALEAAVSEE